VSSEKQGKTLILFCLDRFGTKLTAKAIRGMFMETMPVTIPELLKNLFFRL
jgi:hypothetical protein